MYSCSFIKLRLNHWYHMDYFNDVLITFLGLEHLLAVYGGSESSWISSKIFLICVPKMNEDFTGLEQHEGEELMPEWSFWGELSF